MSDNTSTEKPIARTLCGWCGSGFHKKCEDRDGFILFTNGVHAGNQCKCHDTVDRETGKRHAYEVARSEAPEKSKARRKTKR